tara:strand:+ start:1345 stop:1608 length:264 start_codon:yes stop_codon:yes gene_type:complete
MKNQKHIEVMKDLFSLQDMARLFNRTELTVHIWKTKRDMPHIVIPGTTHPAIRFRLPKVVKWAAANKKKLNEEVLRELQTGDESRVA